MSGRHAGPPRGERAAAPGDPPAAARARTGGPGGAAAADPGALPAPPELPPDPDPARGRPALVRAVLAEWPLAGVLAVCGAGLLVVLSEHFRRGTVLFAGGLVLAAGLRLVLPTPAAGLLAVRGRAIDVVTLAALGLGVLLAALVVPPPS